MTSIHLRKDGTFSLAMSKNLALVREVKALFHPKADFSRIGQNAWIIGNTVGEVRDLVRLSQEHAWRWAPDAWAHAESIIQRADARFANVRDLDESILLKTLRPFQVEGVRALLDKKRVLLADQMGTGKQQRVDANVLTPSGWTAIGALNVGDQVIGSDGQPCTVTGVHPQGKKASYRVVLSDGSSVEAGPEHLWTVMYRNGGKVWQNLTLTTDQLRTRPIIDLDWGVGRITQLDLSKTHLYIPLLSAPVNYPRKPLLLPAYLIGQLIANGSLAHGTPALSCHRDDWNHIKARLLRDGVVIGGVNFYGKVVRSLYPGILSQIRELGLDVLSGEKSIPEPYLRSSPQDRIDLFHGLMDGDGSITKTRNRIAYHTISSKLAHDVKELVQGFGGIASIRTYDRSHEGKPVEYHVRIRLPEWVKPFTTERKLTNHNPGSRSVPRRTVQSIEYVEDVESVCISVDAPDRLYVTEDHILTHNTVQAIAAAHIGQLYPCLVIAPKSVIGSWAAEFKGWCREAPSLEVLETGADAVTDADVHLITWDLLRSNESVGTIDYQCVIMDEAHRIRNHKRKRSIATAEIVKGVPYRWALTGTPFWKAPKDVINILSIIDRLDDVGGKWHFAKRYCGLTNEKIGWDRRAGKPITRPSMDGATHPEELNEVLRETCMVRRTKAEVLPDMPPKSVKQLPVVLPPLEHMAYERAEKKYLDSAGDGANELLRLNELRQLSAQGKIPHAIEWVQDAVAGGEKVVVFTYHEDVRKRLVDAFGSAAVSIHGHSGSADARRDQSQRFQTDDTVKVMVANMVAAGEGVTLTAASNALFVELWWTPSAHNQALDRLHRIGQQNAVIGHFLIAENTVDEDMWATVSKRDTILNAATDGAGREKQAMISEVVRRVRRRAL